MEPTARPAPLPNWLADLRQKIAQSHEFRNLTQKLYQNIRQAQKDEKLPPFYALNDDEQAVLVRRANQTIDHTTLNQFKDIVWRAIDHALDQQAEDEIVHRVLNDEPNEKSSRKMDKVIGLACTGARSLLGRTSGHESLGWLVNADMPSELRITVWGFKLSGPAHRSKFEAARSESLLKIISPRDATILEYCQLAVQSADAGLLSQLARMKECASYVDTIRPSRKPPMVGKEASRADAIVPTEIFWLMPLMRAFPQASIADLVEMYEVVLDAPKPHLAHELSAVLNPSEVPDPDLKFCHAILKIADAPLANHLEKRLGVSQASKLTSIASRRLCVGFFSPACTALAWDIGILAGWKFIENVIAAGLIAMRTGILGCTSWDEINAYIQEFGPRLGLNELREALGPKLMDEIRAAANRVGSATDVPLLTPSGIV